MKHGSVDCISGDNMEPGVNEGTLIAGLENVSFGSGIPTSQAALLRE